ncbi:NfeD family protein [Lawsonibacter faecis]|uniref:NfeD family protein n=1 Tax=Lawsonibacter faecis TaxID=2763052 RepID=A0A8J6JAD0_9FIRM|nr:NfeD family protein [Lawsonibacter faecis]MBC5735776.1 NfeD family protein [Lawsonibacter faecis]
MEWTQYLPSICWAAALIVFAVVEGVTVGLVSIWFAIGSLAALITSVFTDNLLVQVIVFLAVSLVALLIIRPMARRATETRRVATNADRAIGAEGVVTEEIDNLKAQGQVTVAGVVWTARADGDEVVPRGAKVRVLRIEGVKVIVTPSAQPAAVRAER